MSDQPGNLQHLASALPDFAVAPLLVGTYLQGWGSMERQIDKAVGTFLDLHGLQRIIITSDMTMNRKLQILDVAIDTFFDGKEKKKGKELISDIRGTLPHRNMMAHAPFFTEKSDQELAVKFFYTEAKNKLKFEPIILTIHEFACKITEINEYRTLIDALKDKLEGVADLFKVNERLTNQLPPDTEEP